MNQVTAFLDWLAGHKGIPVLLGIALIVANFIVSALAGDTWAGRTNVLLHVGLIIALGGGLLADVL